MPSFKACSWTHIYMYHLQNHRYFGQGEVRYKEIKVNNIRRALVPGRSDMLCAVNRLFQWFGGHLGVAWPASAALITDRGERLTKHKRGIELCASELLSVITIFMGPTCDRPQMGAMLAPWTLLSGMRPLTYWPENGIWHIVLMGCICTRVFIPHVYIKPKNYNITGK